MDKTVTLKAVKGLRNNTDGERFDLGDLAVAKNINLDSTGRISRRKGYKKIATGEMHSAWSDGRQAFVVANTSLHRIEPDLSMTDLYWSFAGGRITYASVGEAVYMSDGYTNASVRIDRRVREWGMDAVVVPHAERIDGQLPQGMYQYTMTYVRDDGYEGPASRAKAIHLSGGSGLRWEKLPTNGIASYINIYLSSPDGELLSLAGKYWPEEENVQISAISNTGVRLKTQFRAKPPPGKVFGPWNGRIFIANGNFIAYTLPYEYELCLPHKDWWAFDSEVMTMSFVDDGVYVGTRTKHFFLAGTDPGASTSREVLPYGSIPGTEVLLRPDLVGDGASANKAALWMSTKGVCLGLPGGQVTNVTGERYAPVEALYGAGVFLDKNGLPQYRVNLFDDDLTPPEDNPFFDPLV